MYHYIIYQIIKCRNQYKFKQIPNHCLTLDVTALVIRSRLPVRGPLVVRIILPRLPGAAVGRLLRPPGGDHAGVADEAPLPQLGPDAGGRRAAGLGVFGQGGCDPDPRECRNGDGRGVTPHGAGGGDVPQNRYSVTLHSC